MHSLWLIGLTFLLESHHADKFSTQCLMREWGGSIVCIMTSKMLFFIWESQHKSMKFVECLNIDKKHRYQSFFGRCCFVHTICIFTIFVVRANKIQQKASEFVYSISSLSKTYCSILELYSRWCGWSSHIIGHTQDQASHPHKIATTHLLVKRYALT